MAKTNSTTRRNKKASKRRWVTQVSTVSTFPPEGIFTKRAPAIAATMASKKVSPKGIGSAIRMVQYFINRGGKGLSSEQKNELKKAKHLLQATPRPCAASAMCTPPSSTPTWTKA